VADLVIAAGGAQMVENRTVLIVDHEPRAAVDMGRVLRSAGCQVFEASNGKECLSLAREKRPQLILVDEALPDISGIDLVKEVKRDAELSHAYIAMLSRDGTAPAIQARALENGADALILRSAQTRELLARVDSLLRRQVAEETLHKSLQDYRATFDAISDAVYLVNTEYTITDCNLAMAHFLARPRGEIVGGRCFELVHGTAKPLPACLGHRVRDTRRRETLVVPMDERWLEVDVDPLLDPSGAVIGSVHVLRDITEQRRIEDALQRAQAELDARATEHHLALDKANKDLQAEIDARVHTQDALKQTQTDLERRGQELEQAIQARQSAEEALQQAQQELVAAAAQRRAQEERQALTAQLHQEQKMDALRRLASAVANEFNRLLATIVGQVELLLARIEPSNPLKADLQAIAKVARQGVALIRQLLAFAGREPVRPEMLDVNAAIQKLKPKLRRALGQGIELQLALAPQLRPVYADARVLDEIWLSLATRAAAAMPHGGVLRVDTAAVALTPADVRIMPLAREGDYVRVTLAHKGAAFADAVLEGIFELQLAPAEAKVGGELGLGVLYGLVQQLGGFMQVAQTAGGETAWEVYLPVHPVPGAGEVEAAGAQEPPASATVAEASASAEAVVSSQPPASESAAPESAEPTPAAAEVASAEAMLGPASPEAASTPAAEPGSATAEAPPEPAPSEPVGAPSTEDAGPTPPAAEASTPDLSQQGAPQAQAPASVPEVETRVARETPAAAPTASEGTVAAARPELPAWLVEQPGTDDITSPNSEPPSASREAASNITEDETLPQPSPRLSGLRSRLGRMRKGKNK
jgi:PAS domain S-box-containing protein